MNPKAIKAFDEKHEIYRYKIIQSAQSMNTKRNELLTVTCILRFLIIKFLNTFQIIYYIYYIYENLYCVGIR